MTGKKVEKQKINLDARNKVIIEAIHEPVLILNTDLRIFFRSEERRVGKECRSRSDP
jgi:hypothetical protein